MKDIIKINSRYISKDPVIRYSLKSDRHPRKAVLRDPVAVDPVVTEPVQAAETAAPAAAASAAKSGKKSGKRERQPITFGRAMRQLGITFVFMFAAMGIIFFVHNKIETSGAYAITSSAGDAICYVTGKENAEKVVQDVYDEFTPEGAAVKAVSSNGTLSVERALGTDDGDIISAPAAVRYIVKECQDEENPALSLTLAAVKTDEVSFTPKTEYRQDDSMLAGESRVEVEGRDGSKDVTKVVTVTNGEIVDELVLEEKVTDEGEAKVIYKGILGLPDGEDWKTYEGDPVFNDAQDLIKTAKQYLGAPYKYGGKSLTNGIDCVQYVRQMFAKYGISIPNKHSQIHKVGKGVSLENIQPGDIVCYTHHVAIYIGNGKVINATRKKGVAISNLHMNKKLITIRRVVH